MSVHIPVGGFAACVGTERPGREELFHRLAGSGARVQAIPGEPVVLAAWPEFAGQGLWVGERGAVAYDLDLINETELRSLVPRSPAETEDPGELLWVLYREIGEGFLDRLRGPFAFALWDAFEKSLLLATDPYGIRPVVYAQKEDGLVAGSRIRHLLGHPDVAQDLRPEALYQYLFFSAIPSPATIYKQIQKLEPGHFAWYRRDGLRRETHYDIRFRPDLLAGERYWRRAIPIEVQRAVSRLVGLSNPEETGCFLSGGTDSSSVAGLYTRLCRRPARTFSIGFDEPGYNELGYAHIAARHFRTEQHDYFVTPEDVLSLVQTLPRLYDEPFGNSSVVPVFYCCKLAREAGVRALLAGDGGDEIFGGNERYVTNLVFERYAKVPTAVRKRLVEPLLRALPGVGPVYRAQRYTRRAGIPNPDRFFSYNLLAEIDGKEVFRPEFLAQIDRDCFLEIARAHYARARAAHDTDRLLYLDMKLTITDNDLRKVRQMAEAAGVRVRYPFLDRELVDFAGTIPPALKVKPGKNRYIFKQAMAGLLPREIIAKEKHGFGLPIGPWFRQHMTLASLLNDTLFSGAPRVAEFMNPEFLLSAKRQFQTESASYYGANLWVFLMLELWLRESGNRRDGFAR